MDADVPGACLADGKNRSVVLHVCDHLDADVPGACLAEGKYGCVCV